MKSSYTKFTLGLAFAFSVAACGGGGDVTITDQPLSGTVGGEAWTFQAGHTDAFLSDGDGFFALLFAEGLTVCDRFAEPEGPKILVSIPTEVGEFEFGLGQTMTFVPAAGENLIVTEGVIAVDEITATTIRGGLHGIFDDDNEVDGNFEITICADE